MDFKFNLNLFGSPKATAEAGELDEETRARIEDAVIAAMSETLAARFVDNKRVAEHLNHVLENSLRKIAEEQLRARVDAVFETTKWLIGGQSYGMPKKELSFKEWVLYRLQEPIDRYALEKNRSILEYVMDEKIKAALNWQFDAILVKARDKFAKDVEEKLTRALSRKLMKVMFAAASK